MDITPKQFNALLRELRNISQHLEEFRKYLDEQIRAISTAQQRREDNRNIQPIWIEPILAKYEKAKTERETEGNREYSVNNSARWAAWCTCIATTLAFGAAAYYASVAKGQLKEMRIATQATKDAAGAGQSAAKTASKQFDLTQKQIIGTMAAALSFGGPEISRDRSQVTISIGNTGRVFAPTAKVTITIVRQTLDGLKPVSKPQIYHYTLTQIAPSLRMWLKTFKLSPPLERDFRNQIETYTISGVINSDDGFGNKLTNSVCYSYLSYARVEGVEEHEGVEIFEGFYPCDEFVDKLTFVKEHHVDW